MKNYFSDSQVIELINKTLPRYIAETSIDDLKSLMNLAVEVAIGSEMQDYSTILKALDEGRASILVDGVIDSIDGGIIYTDLNDAIEEIKELDN